MIITILEIPVPIPNTEVKQNSAEDTCGLPCWENRLSLGLIYSSLAQLVERPAVNRQVVGSSPTRGAIDDFHRTTLKIFNNKDFKISTKSKNRKKLV